MLESITAFFKAHEPTSEEAIVIIRHAIKLLAPTEVAELKMIVAALDTVDKDADAVVVAPVVVAPIVTNA